MSRLYQWAEGLEESWTLQSHELEPESLIPDRGRCWGWGGQIPKVSRKAARLGGRGVWREERIQVKMSNCRFGKQSEFSGSEPYAMAY